MGHAELAIALRRLLLNFHRFDVRERRTRSEWVGQGMKLSEIQNRLGSEFGLRLTYMEVRMLVDDLKLVPKDIEPLKTVSPLAATSSAPTKSANTPAPGAANEPNLPEPAAAAAGSVSVGVDQITRPGAVVSGKVTFSDGQRGEWYFDQTGRLALATEQPG